MSNKKSMYAIERNDEYLAHYGIKGMKWGVRKALASGSDRALARQYRKASRKLEKLQKRAESGKKYARRAAALGAGAAAAGGLAAAGTKGVANAVARGGQIAATVYGKGAKAVGGAMQNVGRAVGTNQVSRKARAAGWNMVRAGRDISRKADKAYTIALDAQKAQSAIKNWGKGTDAGKALETATKIKGLNKVTNDTLARIGAGAAGVGLAAGAGYNAYRAATTKKAAQKAANFKREMNQAFKGTKYANGENGSNSSGKRKRRRNG